MRKSEFLNQKEVSNAIHVLQQENFGKKARNTVSFNTQDYNKLIETSSLQKDIKRLANHLKEQEQGASQQNRQSQAVIVEESQQNQQNQQKNNPAYMERFEVHMNEKQHWLEQQKQQNTQRNLEVLQNNPTILEKSRQLVQKMGHVQPLYQRSIQMHSYKMNNQKTSKQQMKEDKDQMDYMKCTFKPKVNQDIGCTSKFRQDKKHIVKEEEQLTFKPKLNKNSLRLANSAKRDQKSFVESNKKKQQKNSNQSMEKIGTNTPYINKQSQKLANQKYQHLDSQQKQTYLYDNFMKGLNSTATPNKNQQSKGFFNSNSANKYSSSGHTNQDTNNQQHYDHVIKQLKSIQKN